VAWGSQRYGRYLAQTWPNTAGKEYWVSFAFELQSFTTNGWAGVGLWYNNNEQGNIGHEWGNDTIGVFNYNYEGHSSYSVHDGPQWLVAKVIMTGDTLNNRCFLWVSPNPNGSEPDTNTADARGFWRMDSGFNRVVVHFGGEGVGMSMAVDEIRIGTAWSEVSSPVTSVPLSELRPINFDLSQNYPNPFNPTTNINYSVKNSGYITLKVYNILGQPVATLFEGIREAGTYKATFDASRLPSGVYFTRLQAGDVSITKKMLLLK